jgi:hypothetical protein
VLWTAAASLAAGVALAAAPASLLARFAASLLPGVPLGLAELLMTPLLVWPIEVPPFSAARLQPDTPAVKATADSAISMCLVTCRMIRSPRMIDPCNEAFDMPMLQRRPHARRGGACAQPNIH